MVSVKSPLFNRLRGYVRVELRGGQLEKLLNLLTTDRFAFWDVRRTDEQTVTLYVTIRDFFRLRPNLRRTGSKVKVTERHGFPFVLERLGRRKTFLAGIVCFFVSIFVLSSLVWSVDVEGNDKIPRSDIVQAAREQGIYRFQWKFRLPDPDRLSRELQARLPGTAWVGVEVQGTHVQIKVVESARPDKRELMSPRHLVAAKNATITTILAEKGKPLVKPKSNVNKGDILISGYIGDETNRQAVVAQGVVRGIVWEEATVEIPLTLRHKVYTGASKTRSYLVIGNRGLQLTGYGKLPFERFETISDHRTVQWRNWRLPIGWLKETLLESKIEEIPLDPEQAKQMALDQARAEVVAAAGPDAVCVGEKIILHEKSDNGKVYMKVLFEIDQPIAVEQPIVP